MRVNFFFTVRDPQLVSLLLALGADPCLRVRRPPELASHLDEIAFSNAISPLLYAIQLDFAVAPMWKAAEGQVRQMGLRAWSDSEPAHPLLWATYCESSMCPTKSKPTAQQKRQGEKRKRERKEKRTKEKKKRR